MKLLLVVVGRVRGALAEAVAEYESRAERYWKLEVVEVQAGVRGGQGTPERVREAEGERILAKVPPELELVALTREGTQMGSRELARYLNEHGVRSSPGVAFAIGGAFGLDAAVLSRATRRLGLSELTMPHEMARLVLAEQLYRAGTILKGEPYHKA